MYRKTAIDPGELPQMVWKDSLKSCWKIIASKQGRKSDGKRLEWRDTLQTYASTLSILESVWKSFSILKKAKLGVDEVLLACVT